MNIEGRNMEFKRELADSIEKDVVSFLNTLGGEIYIGIDDDGAVVGVDDPDAVQLALNDRIKNNIRPETLGLYDIHVEEREGLFGKELYVVKDENAAVMWEEGNKAYILSQSARNDQGKLRKIVDYSAWPLEDGDAVVIAGEE